MRVRAVALLVVLAGLAGCLQAGEPVEQTDASSPATTNVSPDEDTSTEEGSNGAAEPDVNETATTNTTDEAGANRTEGAETAQVRSQLPGNLSMEGADVVERSDRHVTFRWKGLVGPSPGGTDLAARTTFDVPANTPLEVRANLSWPDLSNLDLAVDGKHVESYCSSTGASDPGQEGGSESCSVRTFARSSWDTWGVRVDGNELGQEAPPRPTSFTADLTIEVTDRWSGPPVDVPPADGPPTSPGWPAIEDAQLRPGVKVGSTGFGLNSGTGNFLFSSPDNSTLYLGWVAHGVDGMEPGDKAPLPAAGVEATLVYCSWGQIEETVTCPTLEFAPERTADKTTHPRFFNDFALFQLPTSARSLAHPAVPVWGGPTGVASPPGQGTELLGFGNTPFRDAGQPRVNPVDPMRGLAWSSTERSTQAHLAPQPVPGDSGSPVLASEGQALGTISAIGPPALSGSPQDPQLDPDSGTTVIPNLANAVAVMENETALDVELKTWSLFGTPRAEDLADVPAGPVPPATAPTDG